MIRRQGTRRRRTGDEGYGLPELLVSMALFGIVIAAVSAVFVNAIDSVRFVSTKTATTADARIAMEAMTRSLRVAIQPTGLETALAEADDDRIVFYSSMDRGTGQTADSPTRVTYEYDPTSRCLEETQVVASVNPDASERDTIPLVWTGAGTSKCLIETNAPPQFDYFDDGRIVGADGVTAVSPLMVPGGGWEADDGASDRTALSSVVSIQMSLNVQDPDAVDINGTLARDRVTLTNVLTARSSGG